MNNRAKTIATIGKVIGTLASAFWILILILSAFSESEPITWEGLLLFSLVMGASIGVAMSYRQARAGAYITLFFSLALGIFAITSAGHNHWLAVLISAGPFTIAGMLLWFGSREAG